MVVRRALNARGRESRAFDTRRRRQYLFDYLEAHVLGPLEKIVVLYR